MRASRVSRRSKKCVLLTDRRYPAFFLYIFTALHEVLPAEGRERPAQYIYLGLYLFNLLLISTIYYLAGRTSPQLGANFGASPIHDNRDHEDRPTAMMTIDRESTITAPPQALLIPLALSKREHSIYMLRLFNDPWAMMLLYSSVLAFMLGGRRNWRIGSVLFRRVPLCRPLD